jgi:DNA-directed RNA polymerase specialized sigma24 family protein
MITSGDASLPRASGAQFDALMRRLGVDGAVGPAYEALRRRLIRFFRVYVPAEADELADVALDRLARKIHEGTDVANMPLYALGIARMVLHETRARGARKRSAEADPTLVPDGDDEPANAETETALAALSACLDSAGGDTRTLILQYYGADGAQRIATRQRLAGERGISLNALRNRALRMRDALEECVRARLGPADPA